jgi:hypothetical protein
LSIMPLDFGLINGLILLKIRKKLTIWDIVNRIIKNAIVNEFITKSMVFGFQECLNTLFKFFKPNIYISSVFGY